MNRSIEAQLETRQLRRMRAEDRYLTRLEAQERKAEALIGELCKEGRTVYYINLKKRNGQFTGKIKEGGFSELTDYLIRNHYV